MPGDTIRHLDLFSGIGGFALAAKWLDGFQTVRFVESNDFCKRVLRKHWPTVPISHDVCSLDCDGISANLITAGFPCQDISSAGRQKGIAKETRSGNFFCLMSVIKKVKPAYVVLENVPNILNNGISTVYKEMAASGYCMEWACISAASIGACHKRNRWWAVAYPISYGIKRHLQQKISWQSALQRVKSFRGIENLRNGPSPSTPKLLRRNDGLPDKLDRLQALGNSVVPHVAMIPLARVAELHALQIHGP